MHASLSPPRRLCPSAIRLAVVAAAFVPITAWSQGPLSLAAAVRMAAEQSRLLAAGQAQAQAAGELVVAAGQRPDPVLKAGITNLPIDGGDRFSLTRDFMTMRSVGVMQEWTNADKLRARAARAEREIDLARAGRDQALAALQRETAAAWLERRLYEQMRGLVAQQRAEATLQIDAAESAYRTGRGSQADVFAARSSVARIDDREREVEAQIETATARLSRWIGDAAESPLDDMPDLARAPTDEALLTAGIERQPVVALAASQEAAALADADVAKAARRADWSVELMFSQRGPAYSNMVSVGVSVPLQIDRAGRQDRELAARLAQADQMKAQREDAARSALADARVALRQWQSRRQRIALHGDTLIPLAAERTRAALTAYRGGGVNLAAVLDARAAELDARIDRLKLEMEAAALWAQLAYLVPSQGETRP
jgi:outer membrane protein TolC